jgi:hypothetical protein
MPGVIDRHPLNNAIKAMLEAITQRPGEIGHAPPDAAAPYFIVYPVDGGGSDGSMAFPDENTEFVYEITSVGRTAEQVEMMGDRVWRAMLERDASGKFLHPIALAGGVGVSDRRPYGGRGSQDRQNAGPAPEKVVISLPQKFSVFVA